MFKTEEQYSLCQELCTELARDLQKEGLKVLGFYEMISVFSFSHCRIVL